MFSCTWTTFVVHRINTLEIVRTHLSSHHGLLVQPYLCHRGSGLLVAMRWLLHLSVCACTWRATEAAIEAHVVFPHIDEDGNGELTPQELQGFMERTSDVLEDFYIADVDRDERVTLDELKGFVPGADSDYYATFVDEFDDSGDGVITLAEWRHHHGYEREAKDMMFAGDTNADRYMSELEFGAMAKAGDKIPERLRHLFDSTAPPHHELRRRRRLKERAAAAIARMTSGAPAAR